MFQSTLIPAAADGLRPLGDARVTQWLIGTLVAAVFCAHVSGWLPADVVALPMAALVINLLATIATRPALRRQPGLLVFHGALAMLLGLAALASMTGINGRFELTEGEVFDGQLLAADRGWLHPDTIDSAAFLHHGFEIEYGVGMRRGKTRNLVEWVDDGIIRREVIGDQTPLAIGSYRFYTTANKGFAPVLAWHARGRDPVAGAIHLPSYPLNAHEQSQRWTVPGTAEAATVSLLLAEPPVPVDRAVTLTRPGEHRLRVQFRGQSVDLHPGEAWSTNDGELRYVQMRSWMGYKVSHAWAGPWLLATSLVGVLGLAWHFICKFGRSRR